MALHAAPEHHWQRGSERFFCQTNPSRNPFRAARIRTYTSKKSQARMVISVRLLPPDVHLEKTMRKQLAHNSTAQLYFRFSVR